MAGRAVHWTVFGLADVLPDRSVSRPDVVAESGTAPDVNEAGQRDGLGIAATRSVGPIGDSGSSALSMKSADLWFQTAKRDAGNGTAAPVGEPGSSSVQSPPNLTASLVASRPKGVDVPIS
jgi:hypothetical protein